MKVKAGHVAQLSASPGADLSDRRLGARLDPGPTQGRSPRSCVRGRSWGENQETLDGPDSLSNFEPSHLETMRFCYVLLWSSGFT